MDYSNFTRKFVLLVPIERNTTRDYISLRIEQLSEQKIKSIEFSEKATLLQVLDEGASVLFALS